MNDLNDPNFIANKERVKRDITGKLMRYYGRMLDEANDQQVYQAVAMTVRDDIMQTWTMFKRRRYDTGAKRLYYLSFEFLVGRSLACNLINLLETDVYREALKELDISIDHIEEQEPDAGLGNGGLGRLAACFMDSIASLGYPAMGCSIRYEYGLFKQEIIDGEQVEVPDNWMDSGTSPWEIPIPEDQVEVKYGGNIVEDWSSGRLKIKYYDYYTVIAMPYDMPIIGYAKRGATSLRLWSAKAPMRIDMKAFNQGDYIRAMQEKELAEVISKVLYPEDNHRQGKELRLKQQYFLSSASIQYIVRDFKRRFPGLPMSQLHEKAAIHVNDTHPALAIPELMRILLDEEGLTWNESWNLTRRLFAYTNHTVMSEALERWPEDMLRPLLPRIYTIIAAINSAYCEQLLKIYPGQWEKVGDMAIIKNGEIRMANLCIALSHKVNGVSQLHADILKHDLFYNFYTTRPGQFTGITNGITHRRWVMNANPELTRLLRDTIGDGWITEPMRLRELMPFADDAAFREKFAEIKRHNKTRLAKHVKKLLDITLNEDSIFDVQAKRLHEYKRQLLNAIHIVYLYNTLLENPKADIEPRTFMFAAKAAPGYERAKLIIRFIHAFAKVIEANPVTREKIRIVFLPNYSVTLAEVLIPASEVSEQISIAGKEASGTGNMKFMMNGALTIGTMDGANVEMSQAAGEENMFIFGLTAQETASIYRYQNYNPGSIYESDARVRMALNRMIDGTVSDVNLRQFSPLYHSLIFGDGGMADTYMLLADFDSYAAAQHRIQETYRKPEIWWKKAVINTAASGIFSSDRTIEEYNEKVWKLPAISLT